MTHHSCKHKETLQTLRISMSECLTVMRTNTNTHEDRLGVCCYELHLWTSLHFHKAQTDGW